MNRPEQFFQAWISGRIRKYAKIRSLLSQLDKNELAETEKMFISAGRYPLWKKWVSKL